VRPTAGLLPALLLTAALAGCGAGADPSGSAGGSVPPGTAAPDAPVSTELPAPAPGTDPTADLRPARVTVVPRAVDLRPQPFHSAQPLGERQLTVRFWGGVAPCSVVGRVDVEETPERVRVTVFSGRDPRPGRVACVELAVYQEVVVDLAAPVAGRAITDGAG